MSLYSIYVLEYGYVPEYDKSGVIYGAHNEGYVKLPYCYAVIKGKDWAAMVDVGYNDKDYGKYLGDLFNVKDWNPPKDGPRGNWPDARGHQGRLHHARPFRPFRQRRGVSQRDLLYPEEGAAGLGMGDVAARSPAMDPVRHRYRRYLAWRSARARQAARRPGRPNGECLPRDRSQGCL